MPESGTIFVAAIQSGQIRQQLQVRRVFLRRHQQNEDQIYRLTVDGVVVDRLGQRETGGMDLLAVDPAVGNCDPLAEPGAPCFPPAAPAE